MSEKVSGKQAAGCAMGLISLCITTPIWYWLVYQILVRVDATPTMWVFYWIYMPAGVALSIAKTAVENVFADKK